eukprot:gene19243-25873_t
MTAREEDNTAAPFITAMSTFFMMSVMFIMGKFRDFFSGAAYRHTRQGYAPIRELFEDFYQRRMFSRIKDCWNRPICSAPSAWIDVMDRTDITRTSGVQPLQLTGSTTRCLNLGSYNYLGFAASDPYCTPRVQKTLSSLGVSSCSSRADAGTTPVHVQLEEAVAEFMGQEAALTCGMGYATNSAIIPCLMNKGDLLISDMLNHASIVAGARASGAKVKVFRHNDVAHLDAVLRSSIAEGQPRTRRPWKKIFIIVEGIYSMEGEICLLKEIVEVKKKYKVPHSIGAMGLTGRGCCEHVGVNPRGVDILMGTFTKSFGSCGGYIAGSRALIDHLKRWGPAHLMAGAMSPASAEQILSALQLLDNVDGSGRGPEKLHDNANYVRQRLIDQGLKVLGDIDSPVMPIMIYHPGKIPAFSRFCMERGLAMVVVGFPATALLLSRARVCISAAHSREDLDYAVEALDDVTGMCMMRYEMSNRKEQPLVVPSRRSRSSVASRGRKHVMTGGAMYA